ncbi:hypothetical protein Y032_0090g2350 [Ancylostoma ceylanicum]|nr:hypothetical protein Y032_0090g2350 [Ancylostoma ceylanicum]
MRFFYAVLALLAFSAQRSTANFPIAGYPDNPPFGFHEPPYAHPYIGELGAAGPLGNAPQPAPAYPFGYPFAYPFGYPFDLYNWYSRLFDPRTLFNNVPKPFPRGTGPLSYNSFVPPMATKASKKT